MKNIKKAKKGFTIVELVIVIGVIGILAGILIPTFVNVTQSANEAKLKSDLNSAFTSYVVNATDGQGRITNPKDVVVGFDETTDAGKIYFYEAETGKSTVEQNKVVLKNTEGAYMFGENGWSKFDITVSTTANGVAYFMDGTTKTYVDVAFNGYSIYNSVAHA